MRTVRTSHECNFQDMWKWKSARPTTSRKAGYAPGNLSCTDPLSLYRYLYKQKVPKEQSFHKTEVQNLYKTKLNKKKMNECPNSYYYQLLLWWYVNFSVREMMLYHFAGAWVNYLQSELFGSFFILKLLFMVRERHSVLQIPAKLQHVKKSSR